MSNYIDPDKFNEYFNQIIIHLSENKDVETDYDALLKTKGIPDSYSVVLWNKLWNSNPRFVEGNRGLKKMIKINDVGLKHYSTIKKNVAIVQKQVQQENLQSELDSIRLENERLTNEQLTLNKQNRELDSKYNEGQHQLTALQIKEHKNKRKIAIGAFILGAIVTNAKDILEILRKWLQI